MIKNKIRNFNTGKKLFFITYILILSLFLLNPISNIFAESVKKEMAKKAAENYLRYQLSSGLHKQTLSTSIAELKEINDNNDRILAYIVELMPEGFLIISGDTDIKPIIGYSYKGKFPFVESSQNVLLHLVKWDMEARLKSITSYFPDIQKLINRNNELWNDYISGNIEQSYGKSNANIWGPLITTNWHQRDPYNKFCPLDPMNFDRSYVGCVATATAQISYYWKFPKSIQFYNEDEYTSSGHNGNIRIPEDYNKFQFPTFDELNINLNNISYNGDKNEIAYLCFGIGIKHEMSYSDSGSGAYTNASVYKKLGYGSAYEGSWEKNYYKVIDNIKIGWPAQISIYNPEGGHSIIVDGYDETNGYFHVNMGWGGSRDPWYDFPDIGRYHVIGTVVYDICPYQSWPQVGGDGANSFRIPYNFPKTSPNLKWIVSTPNKINYGCGFSHTIVGTKNKVYAALSSTDFGVGNSPYITIINPYGYIEKNIKINDADTKIKYLSQNVYGEIFFGTSNDQDIVNIYKIDMDGENDNIFTSSIKGFINNPIKVDSLDNIFFIIEPKNSYDKWRIHSIKSDGTSNWEYVFSENETLHESVIAIDNVRNNVYINYYNTSERNSYVKCFDKYTGDIRWLHKFPNTQSIAGRAGLVSIAKNGNIYVGCYTYFYALSPVNGNELWRVDFYPSYANYQHALGFDGTIYVRHTKYNSNIPGFISAISPSGSIKWEVHIIPSLDQFDIIGEMYSSKNDMIILTYKRKQGNEWHTTGLLDQGNYGKFLWDIKYGGSKMTFDSGETIYLSNLDAYSSLYALSIGERGDPEGLAMGWTDNSPPKKPLNPQQPTDGAEGLDTANVALSWSFNDLENNSLKYDVYLGDSKLIMTLISDNITHKSFTIGGLLTDTKYNWKVIASDGQATTEGPIWSFTTKTYSKEGDANDDGVITISDVNAVINYILPGRDSTRVKNFDNADCAPLSSKGDGELNIFDVIQIIEFILHPEQQLKSIPVHPKISSVSLDLNKLEKIENNKIVLPIELNNQIEISGIQMSMRLNSNNIFPGNIELTHRTKNMICSSSIVKDELRILIYSFKGECIKIGSGSILKIPFKINNPYENGDLNIEEVLMTDKYNNSLAVTIKDNIKLNNDLLMPKNYSLSQNYPNPFNSETTIKYSILKSDLVKLEIYNTSGQLIRMLVNNIQSQGFYNITWDGTNNNGNVVASGLYLYRLHSGQFNKVKKMLFLK